MKLNPLNHTVKLLAPVVVMGLLVGCERTVDCSEAIAEGASLGAQGQLASFSETTFDEACRADFLAAWEEAKDTYCDPMLAFDRAMSGQETAPACQAPSYLRNFQLGANLYALLEEKATVEATLAQGEDDLATPTELQQARMRLRVLEREIPELETLARMRGLMAPAELPPEVNDEL